MIREKELSLGQKIKLMVVAHQLNVNFNSLLRTYPKQAIPVDSNFEILAAGIQEMMARNSKRPKVNV